MADKRPTKLHEEIIAREQLKEPTSKGQLVPFKPQPKVSPLAQVGKFAGKVARRNPLLEIIAQLLPSKEKVSENIKGALKEAGAAQMSRRDFLRRTGGVVANQLAGNPLMKAIIKSAGNIPDAPVPIPQPSLSIEEIIMEELIAARGNPEARRATIAKGLKELGLDNFERTITDKSFDPRAMLDADALSIDSEKLAEALGSHKVGKGFVDDGPAATIFNLDGPFASVAQSELQEEVGQVIGNNNFPSERASELSRQPAPDSHILGERLNKGLGVVAEDDIFRDLRYPGTDELSEETRADRNLRQTIDSWGGSEGYMNHINKLEATGELANPGWGEGTTAEEVQKNVNRVRQPSSNPMKSNSNG